MQEKRGKLILVIGPTGSGKSVLMSYVHEQFPEIVFPITYTTRERRPGVENSSYRFISVEEFETMKNAGEFLEWAQFGNNFYGTSKSEIIDALAEGKILMKEMEVQGVRQVQDLLPADELVLMYIDAGSWEELEKRVRARAPITEDELAKRKHRYEDELPFKELSHYVIENLPGKLEDAKQAIEAAITTVQTNVN